MKEPLVRAVGRTVGRMLPRSWRMQVSAARAAALSARTRFRLQRLAASGRPIIAGPYFGEVGFELLYWIPFLAWFADRYEVAPDRIVAVSRGGASSWYGHVAAQYRDVFDVVDPADFKRRNGRRIEELGEQKQIAITAFDVDIAKSTERNLGSAAELLHPSLMYALLAPFWWGHLPLGWVDSHTRFRRLTPPPLPDAFSLPQEFAAVKFYFNDCFDDTAGMRAFVGEVVRDLSREMPVVSLSTGLTIDDHASCDPRGDEMIIQPGYDAKTNLDVQTAIVAHARRFVGTYGGFAYLSPFFGVPATAYYSNPDGYSVRHLEVARLAVERMGGGPLLDVRHAQPVDATVPDGGLTCSSR